MKNYTYVGTPIQSRDKVLQVKKILLKGIMNFYFFKCSGEDTILGMVAYFVIESFFFFFHN